MQAMEDTLGAFHSCVFHGSVGWLGFQLMIASSWCKAFLALYFLAFAFMIQLIKILLGLFSNVKEKRFLRNCHAIGQGAHQDSALPNTT